MIIIWLFIWIFSRNIWNLKYYHFGAVTAGCGFLYLLYIVVRYFVGHTAPMGWSSTMAVLLLLGGVILLVLGLIGEYVGRIFMCVNAAPQYVVRQVVTSERQESTT